MDILAMQYYQILEIFLPVLFCLSTFFKLISENFIRVVTFKLPKSMHHQRGTMCASLTVFHFQDKENRHKFLINVYTFILVS